MYRECSDKGHASRTQNIQKINCDCKEASCSVQYAKSMILQLISKLHYIDIQSVNINTQKRVEVNTSFLYKI